MSSSPRIIITGASRGIGLAVVRILLSRFNAKVVAIQRTQTPELAELASSSTNLSIVASDITDETQFSAGLKSAIGTLGGLDGLILNAGIAEPFIKIADSDVSAWKKLFDVNFFSLVTALKATIPDLRSTQGKVVFVSSGAAVKGTSSWGAYNASKAAMNSLGRTLAEEEPEITSIALRPGAVDTEMQNVIRSTGKANMSKKDYDTFVKLHAEGKLVKPEDAGHVIAALAVRATKDLSGQFVSWDEERLKDFRS